MYLPASPQEETNWPVAFGKDVLLQVRLAMEKWKRFYSFKNYYMLRKSPTAVSTDAPLSGASGTTAYDPLWGEAVDPQMAVDGKWSQPHLSGQYSATNRLQFYDPVSVPLRVFEKVRRIALQKGGVDFLRTIEMSVPTGILDEAGITVSDGDEFDWDGRRFVVLDHNWTYWKNTNLKLFLICRVETKRAGS